MESPEMREAMVNGQILPEGVTSSRVVDAMLDIPREYFVPRQSQHIAYMGDHFPLSYGRFLLKPTTLAKMIQALDPQYHEKALIVGCNLGYSIAVMAKLVHSVVGVEEVKILSKEAEQILERLQIQKAEVILGPHNKGYHEYGPYDVILVEGTIKVAPQKLLEQLRDGGRLVAITSCSSQASEITLFTKIKGHISQYPISNGAAPTLTGFESENEFQF